jgi:hypothetical protein
MSFRWTTLGFSASGAAMLCANASAPVAVHAEEKTSAAGREPGRDHQNSFVWAPSQVKIAAKHPRVVFGRGEADFLRFDKTPESAEPHPSFCRAGSAPTTTNS